MFKTILLTILLTATTALAHKAPSGWEYDWYCCSGSDCQEISEKHVKAVKGGYKVTMDVGDHVMVTKHHEYFIEQSKVRLSKDDKFHLCLWPDEDTLRCLYAPPMGF